jgi:hypothetical protein
MTYNQEEAQEQAARMVPRQQEESQYHPVVIDRMAIEAIATAL